MKNDVISSEHLVLMITELVVGFFARLITIKEDYRQYPSYPNGYLIHLVTGFVAAAIGAVAIPAIMTKNFVAVTFLALAIQQFRDVRKAERDCLKDLENTEFTPRGDAYIDGIAKTFEARNYFALVVALVTGITMQLVSHKILWVNILIGSLAGLVILFILKCFSKRKTVGDIADVQLGKVEVRDSELFVDGIYVMNQLGTNNARELYRKEGIAAVNYPREEHFRITLDHFGQRQAILFEATRAVGVKRYNFTRKDYEQGRVVVTLVPLVRREDVFIEAIKKTPLLESVKKEPFGDEKQLVRRKINGQRNKSKTKL